MKAKQKKVKVPILIFSLIILCIIQVVYLCTLSKFASHLGQLHDGNYVSSVLSLPSNSVNLEADLHDKKKRKGKKKIEVAPYKVTLRSLGIADKLPPSQFDSMRNTTRITIIISYCEEDIRWISEYIGGHDKYKIKEILIYSKCGKNVRGLGEIVQLAPTKTIITPNVGRCDHSYASWIKDNYHILEEEYHTIKGQDIVLFIKDNDYHRENFSTFEELFTFASLEGFGCAEKPVCDCDNEQCNDKHDIPLLYHDMKKLDEFQMNTHNRLERDMNQPFKSKEYKKLKDWKDAMQLKIQKSGIVPVCYGGVFAAKTRHILNQPKHVWDRMVESLSRGDNIIESHFAERLWAAVLSYNSEEYARNISQVILPHVHDTFRCWNRKGMMMVPKSTGFNATLFSDLLNP